MSYLILNKRQITGKLIACTNFKDSSFINFIRLDKAYKDGTKYAIYETTKSPFCSNGLYKTELEAWMKYNLMVRNASKCHEWQSGYLSKEPEVLFYLTLMRS